MQHAGMGGGEQALASGTFLNTRRGGLDLFALSPLLWPLFFMGLVLLFSPSVPIHWAWDNFLYLSAAHDGGFHVYLGWGRTAFCVLGMGMRFLGPYILWQGLFTTWQMWLATGLVLHTLLLFPLALLLMRRLGPIAAHVALGLFVLHPQQLMVLFGVWAENQALLAFLLAAIILLSRPLALEKRWYIGGFLAVMMVLLKEVNLYYLPFLAGLAALESPHQRLKVGAIFLGVTTGVSLFLYFVAFPAMMPGYLDARVYLESQYFGMESVGLGAAGSILVQMIRALWSSGMVLPLCLLVVPWLLYLVVRRRRRCLRSSLVATGMAMLLVIPVFVVLLASGQVEMMDRQVLALVPGLALLAALPWARPLPPLLARNSWHRVVVVVVLLGAMVGFSKWSLVREHAFNSRLDAVRYAHMETLLAQPHGLWVGADAWPAHYLSLYSGSAPNPPVWDILWPDWTQKEDTERGTEWRERQIAEGRPVAISSAVLRSLDRPAGETFALFPGYTFREHPSGWWIGEVTPPR